MVRKFLMLAAASMMTVLAPLHVSAEQAAAEQYRQIFRSGNFYVEYQIVNHLSDELSKTTNGQKIFRADTTLIFGQLNMKSGKVALASRNGARAVKSKLKDKVPQAMYLDGKYYNYLKDMNLLILPEEQLNSPVLDPDESWQDIRTKLALPDGLAIFYWEDSFRDKNFDWGVPIYSGSSTKTIKKKTYDCDRYTSDIKTLAGTIIAQEVYDALYENGGLVMVQKYFVRDGKEFMIATVNVNTISAQVPDEAFAITKKIKTYAPRNGDMNDLLEVYEQTGEIGGAQK